MKPPHHIYQYILNGESINQVADWLETILIQHFMVPAPQIPFNYFNLLLIILNFALLVEVVKNELWSCNDESINRSTEN